MKTDVVLEHIPLIVVTDSEDRQEVMDCGANAYLHRQQDMAELGEQVRQMLASTHYELDINPLTRLPGSRSSVEEIESLLERGKPFVMHSIHLRNLDFFYTRFGTQRGDSFLRLVANNIRSLSQETGGKDAFVGHLGSQDFVITMPEEKCAELAEKLIEAFEDTVAKIRHSSKEGKEELTAILSIAILNNRQTTFHHLSEMARACEQIHRYLRHYPYSAYLKDRRTDFRDVIMGLAPGTRFDHGKTEKKLLDLQRKVGSTAGLLSEVIDFIKDKNVETHFQPIVLFSKEKKVFAYEALSRFQRADGSFVEPIRMFQAAREANLIKEFDILCALTAMQNAAKIPGGIKLFVNLNRETLIDSDALAQIWNFKDLEPERLVIEITEQSLMRELAQLNESIQSLRGRGIQIALDDAGGGSVSLREAAELKPDYAKFDQSLIQGVATSEMKQKILSSLIVFFKGIGSQTVAEGIETVTDWDYLTRQGIEYGQGYYIAKPAATPLLKIPQLP